MPSAAQPSQRLTGGKLAALADVSANAVRFCNREGLVQVGPAGGHGNAPRGRLC